MVRRTAGTLGAGYVEFLRCDSAARVAPAALARRVGKIARMARDRTRTLAFLFALSVVRGATHFGHQVLIATILGGHHHGSLAMHWCRNRRLLAHRRHTTLRPVLFATGSQITFACPPMALMVMAIDGRRGATIKRDALAWALRLSSARRRVLLVVLDLLALVVVMMVVLLLLLVTGNSRATLQA